METKPEIVGYGKLDSKGRMTIPHELRKEQKGFLIAKYKGILILIDPKIIPVKNPTP